MILSVILLVILCPRENVHAAIAPVEEPDNFLQPLEATNLLPPPISKYKIYTSNFISSKTKSKTTNERKIVSTAKSSRRHLQHLKSNLGPVSFYPDSPSDNGSKDDNNSFGSQRRAFLEILDNNHNKEPKGRARKHQERNKKIKLRYDYINRKYTITENDSEEF